MKLIKILFWTVVWIVVFIVVAVLALPVWFGPVVKGVANSSVPSLVQADFKISELSLNPYNGRFEMGGFTLGNPAGCTEKNAATLGKIVFDVDPLTLGAPVMHIEEIKVQDVFVAVVDTKDNVGNFQQLQYNAAGGKEKYEKAEREKEAKEAARAKAKASVETSDEKDQKYIIDRLEISGLKLKLGVVPIPLPPITLTDIGKKSNGATMEEVWNQITETVLKMAGAVGDGAKVVAGFLGDEAAKLKNVSVKDGVDAVGSGAKAVGEEAEAGAKAVEEGAKKTLDAVKNLF